MVTAAGAAPVEATGLTRLARDPTGTEIHLQGLTLEETGELVLGLKGVRLDPVQLQHLHDVTNGDPLWIRSAAHDIAAEDLRATASLLPVVAEPRAQHPAAIEPLSARRHVLRQALAILDGPQPVYRVASLAGVGDVWAAVDAAMDSALVVTVGSPPDLLVTFARPAIASPRSSNLAYGNSLSLHRAAVHTRPPRRKPSVTRSPARRVRTTSSPVTSSPRDGNGPPRASSSTPPAGSATPRL